MERRPIIKSSEYSLSKYSVLISAPRVTPVRVIRPNQTISIRERSSAIIKRENVVYLACKPVIVSTLRPNSLKKEIPINFQANKPVQSVISLNNLGTSEVVRTRFNRINLQPMIDKQPEKRYQIVKVEKPRFTQVSSTKLEVIKPIQPKITENHKVLTLQFNYLQAQEAYHPSQEKPSASNNTERTDNIDVIPAEWRPKSTTEVSVQQVTQQPSRFGLKVRSFLNNIGIDRFVQKQVDKIWPRLEVHINVKKIFFGSTLAFSTS